MMKLKKPRFQGFTLKRSDYFTAIFGLFFKTSEIILVTLFRKFVVGFIHNLQCFICSTWNICTFYVTWKNGRFCEPKLRKCKWRKLIQASWYWMPRHLPILLFVIYLWCDRLIYYQILTYLPIKYSAIKCHIASHLLWVVMQGWYGLVSTVC